jgi:hypothetical protein
VWGEPEEVRTMTWVRLCDGCGRTNQDQDPVGWYFVKHIRERPEKGEHDFHLPWEKAAEDHIDRWGFCSPECLNMFAVMA